MLSLEDACRYFEIDDSCPSGLRWKSLPPRARHRLQGSSVGTLNRSGYYLVKIYGKVYGIHRIVYCLTHMKELDEISFIDHIDCDKQNNRPENLREASRSQNGFNRGKNKNNTTGYKNVTSDGHGAYRVCIVAGSVQFKLDRIKTLEEAVEIATRERFRLHQEFSKE